MLTGLPSQSLSSISWIAWITAPILILSLGQSILNPSNWSWIKLFDYLLFTSRMIITWSVLATLYPIGSPGMLYCRVVGTLLFFSLIKPSLHGYQG
ncbi:uncharacterized protein BYT42DRAFT_559665, partial [Radiomyces spectabilis]|uniref:uncharacterized protein n=1 Tax=Radiomyces spectabilis TaxID=64574 RepID=UPI00221EADC4